MSHDILTVLDYMEKEKGINRQDMIAVIVDSIKKAAKSAAMGPRAPREREGAFGREAALAEQDDSVEVRIDPRRGDITAWQRLKVTDSLSDPATEISLPKARQIKAGEVFLMKEVPNGEKIDKVFTPVADPKDLLPGETIWRTIDPSVLGRIVAQAARQGIMQRVRQFEKDKIYDEYKGMVGDIVPGIVRRREKGDLIIDLGKAEAVLRSRDCIPGEKYEKDEHIRCLLLEIENGPRGPEIILTRSNPKFVRRLLSLEVTEIADETVTIRALAREPGFRTKIAVDTRDPKVDPVGACVGARGGRVKNIVRELGGEKVDIIRWYDDPVALLAEAIKPAVPHNVRVDAANRRIYFEVAEADLPVAIGRKGQNAKLTSRLMDWRLDISKLSEGDDAGTVARNNAIRDWTAIGVDGDSAAILFENGLANPTEFAKGNATAEDLVSMDFSPEKAAEIVALVQVKH